MRLAAVLLPAVLLAGCRSGGRGLADDDPSFKVPAIKSAVGGEQESAVPQLVASLDDDDPAVRFYAIEGLRRLTGQDFEYHFYDDSRERRPAVDRWKKWLGDWSSQPGTATSNPAGVKSPYDRPAQDRPEDKQP